MRRLYLSHLPGGGLPRLLRNAIRMRLLVKQHNSNSIDARTGKKFAVLVTPWLSTDVPWFSIMMGMLLARRGNEVVFVFDNLPFGASGFHRSCITFCIRVVLNSLSHRHAILRIADYEMSAGQLVGHRSHIEKPAVFNAVWTMRGETLSTGREQYIKAISEQLTRSRGAIVKLLETNSFDMICIPGGVYGASGVWSDYARLTGLRFSSFDSGGYGTLMLAADGIASQLQDIPRAFALLKSSNQYAREKQLAIKLALIEMDKRKAGTDKFASQMIAATKDFHCAHQCVLIALNSSWDSAALGLHAVFESSAQWMTETTRWLLNSTDVYVIIRQHPAERLDIARTSDDYLKLLTENFGLNSRVRFVSATDPVNSYDLISAVSTVIVYTSTMGVEAAALGKCVVTASSSYYSSLGFIWRSSDKEEYFSCISKSIRGELKVTSDMKDDALICYYLAQTCNWAFNPFNPEGFSDWSKRSLLALYNLNDVQLILTSIQDNVPYASLRHNENVSKYHSSHVNQL